MIKVVSFARARGLSAPSSPFLCREAAVRFREFSTFPQICVRLLLVLSSGSTGIYRRAPQKSRRSALKVPFQPGRTRPSSPVDYSEFQRAVNSAPKVPCARSASADGLGVFAQDRKIGFVYEQPMALFA